VKLTSSDEGSVEPQEFGRSVRIEFMTMLMGAALAAVGLRLAATGGSTNFEDAALSKESTAGYATIDGRPIHCRDGRDVDECLAASKAREAKQAVLWLGNSQVHAVNQQKAGETNAPPALFKMLVAKGLDLVTLTQPNANLQEHYVLFEYVRHRAPIKLLILPAVFDDMREDGLREDVAVLTKDKATSIALSRTAIGSRLSRSAPAAVGENVDTKGISDTPQQRAEDAVSNWLAGYSDLWALRPELRGRFLIWLYTVRNEVLGIKPTTKRRVILWRYEANFAAMDAILRVAKDEGIKVILYVVPLRGGVELPYDKDDYKKFKIDVERAALRSDAKFANLENLVPDELWGLKASTSLGKEEELDFMHFQAAGHVLLASRLNDLIADVMAFKSKPQ
jgi:hypothetical protein